jgi:HAD domain in Swiss Army Knife RNA repair proteins
MLILLDIDGVMVPASSWKRPEILGDGFPAFSPKAVKALQKFIFATSADILLTTSHKSKYTIEEWIEIFKRRGINLNSITALPENTEYLTRKDEIINWVNSMITLPYFVIIDDDKSLNALPLPIKERLIQTSGSVGLTEDLINEAIDKFSVKV